MTDAASDPFNCDGCHLGDFPEFDHFCDALDVQDHELPHAFAAWLGHKTGWDGRYEPSSTPAESPLGPTGEDDRE